jgi:hypothetical protein
MRRCLPAALALAALVAAVTAATALERVTIPAPDDDPRGAWNAGTSCTVAYYNVCTGWTWGWSTWGEGDILGVCFDPCCDPGATLLASWHLVGFGAPPGYGYTGSVEVYAADANCCPTGPRIQGQPWLPAEGFNHLSWAVPVPAPFVLVATFPGPRHNPAALLTDRASAGPTGPDPCGTCYPSDRIIHTFYYGTTDTPWCPGVTLHDPDLACDVELIWSAAMACAVPVEQRGWGAIKALYR